MTDRERFFFKVTAREVNVSDGFVDKRETPARERELERNVSKIKNYDIEMLI